jgi:hypothetical protein
MTGLQCLIDIALATGLARLDAPRLLHRIMIRRIERRKLFKNNLLLVCQRSLEEHEGVAKSMGEAPKTMRETNKWDFLKYFPAKDLKNMS